MNQKIINGIYIALVILLLAGIFTGYVTGPIALLTGLIFALVFGKAYPTFNKTMSKKLLQYSVIGLGFGMTFASAIASGADGMLITIVSVFGTLALGTLIGAKLLHVDWQTSYLISSGTAICGGSAIAAVGPVIRAKSESMSVALGVVFILNAIALFIFPPIGHIFEMTQEQFGTWAAIAIHDTSSVVGAGGAYGDLAQEVATTVKLTRALWIVIVALVTPFFFRSRLAGEEGKSTPWYKTVPTFILWFIVAIAIHSLIQYFGAKYPDMVALDYADTACKYINRLAKQLITLSLFFIGAGLTRETLRAVGIRPLIQGVLLWLCIGSLSLAYVMAFV